ncbi:MAG: WD40 repeat domain-containing protein [Treponema sp.]|nr:WD40 repeat domain-containing protein [Treponema sp.]
MKKIITTIILLAVIALNVFAQNEIPMFFDNELGLQLPGNIGFTRRVTYSSDGNRIATTFKNGKIAIWDVATGREITRMIGHNEPVTNIIFSPNGRLLASCAGRDSNIKIWDANSGELIRNIPQDGATNISFSPDSSRLGSSNTNQATRNEVKIWNVSNGNVLLTLVGHTEGIQSFTYSPDGRQILTSSSDGTIKIWNAGNGQIIRTIDSGLRFQSAVYSPNGRHIAAHIHDRRTNIETIRIYTTETGQEVRSISAELSRNLIYSPDGRQLLVNAWIDDGDKKIIVIFDPETGRELRRFNNGDFAASFSTDGRRILTDSATFEIAVAGSNYGASFANILDATTGRNVGVIGYGPLNIGARAFADMQVARFLNDTAAVTRHETVLQWIISRGNVTRADIETFYRNGIRGLISEIVTEKFNRMSFLLSNAVTNPIRDHEMVLTRNPQNGHYTLSYGGYYTNREIRTITAASLEVLLSEMRNGRNRADFDQTGINKLRAQAALMPAVVYAGWRPNGVDAMALITETLTNFYINPNREPFSAVVGICARYQVAYATGSGFADVAARAYVSVLNELNSGLTRQVINESTVSAARVPNDPRFNIFSTPWR